MPKKHKKTVEIQRLPLTIQQINGIKWGNSKNCLNERVKDPFR